MLSKFWEILKALVGLAVGIAGALMLLGTIASAWSSPSAGDECGPANHWRQVGGPYNSDLSCEADAR